MVQQINSPGNVIDMLGGITKVAALFEPALDIRVVCNWRTRGLPPDTFAVLGPLLAERGIKFSAERLFSQRKGSNHKEEAKA